MVKKLVILQDKGARLFQKHKKYFEYCYSWGSIYLIVYFDSIAKVVKTSSSSHYRVLISADLGLFLIPYSCKTLHAFVIPESVA